MIIDAHQHFWHFDPIRDTWIGDSMKVLQRDFLPADLQPVLEENGVSGCIAVQADQSVDETHFLLQLAEKHDFIKKVVGWVDLCSGSIAEQLSYFSQYDKLAGFRHIVQGEQDVNFLLGKDFCRGIAALEQYGFTYDLLVFPHHLGAVLEFVRRFPRQKFVIDHLAKPYIRNGYSDGWVLLMREIAKAENVFCKVSGMITEADWRKWKYDDLLPYLHVITEAFGTERLMYGSDWPVCLLAGSYGQVMGVARRYFENLPTPEKSKVFALNALNFYKR